MRTLPSCCECCATATFASASCIIATSVSAGESAAATGGWHVSSAQAPPPAAAPALRASLRTLWAREKVRTLADYAKLSGDDDTISEVTKLGLEYSLLTPYTSFVAVDQVVRNGQAEMVSHEATQPLPLPQGVSNQVSSGSVPEPSGILLIFVSGLGLLMVRARA